MTRDKFTKSITMDAKGNTTFTVSYKDTVIREVYSKRQFSNDAINFDGILMQDLMLQLEKKLGFEKINRILSILDNLGGKIEHNYLDDEEVNRELLMTGTLTKNKHLTLYGLTLQEVMTYAIEGHFNLEVKSTIITLTSK